MANNLSAEARKIASQLEEMAIDEVSLGITEEMKQNSVPILKDAAHSLINLLESVKPEIALFKKRLADQKKFRNNLKADWDQNAYEISRKQTADFLHGDLVRQMLAGAEEFQIKMNEVLGQEVRTIYVYQDEEGNPELYLISGTEVLSPDVASRTHNVVGRFKLDNAIKNLSTATGDAHIQKLAMSMDYKFNKENLDAAYVESVSRYNYSRQQKKRFVMWKNQAMEWSVMRVSAMGDINEAYAAAILLNRPIPSFSWHFIDWNIGDFMERYVADVDNMSGLLAGDVTVGNIEYAIKSADASMLGINQMKVLAELILNDVVKDVADVAKYKELLRKKARTRNRLISWTEAKMQEATEDEFFDKYEVWLNL